MVTQVADSSHLDAGPALAYTSGDSSSWHWVTSPMASVEGDRMSTGHTASMYLMDTDRGIGAFALRPVRAGERIIAEKPLLELALDDIEGSLN
jgi:hypothetical protein